MAHKNYFLSGPLRISLLSPALNILKEGALHFVSQLQDIQV